MLNTHWTPKWILHLLLAWMALVAMPAFASVSSQPARSVLFINSYHPGFPTFFEQLAGLRQVLEQAHVRLDIEFMDTKRFYSSQDQATFADNLREKLKRLTPYDLVMVADDAALHFVEAHHAQLFPGLPVVFFGVNDVPYALSFNRNPLITGVIENVAFADTVELIRTLYGQEQLLTVISDSTETGLASLDQFRQQMELMGDDRFQVLSLGDYSYDELTGELGRLPPDVPVLLLSIYRDRTGAARNFDSAFGLIRASTRAPVFHCWYHGLGRGVLGGKLVSHRKQAVIAGETALRILHGESPADIPIVQDSGNEFVFDYGEMERLQLSPSALPDGSRILNQPEAGFGHNRTVALASLAFAALLVTVVAALLIRIRVRENAAQRMLRINQELEEKVAARTQALDQARQEAERLLRMRDSILDNSLVAIVLMKGRSVEWINQHAEELFGYPLNEVTGRTSDFIYEHYEDFVRLGADAPPVLQKGESYRAEYAYRRKDGSVFWGIISGKAINPRDLAEGALFIIVDITARKLAEERLKKLNLMLENQATTDHLTGIANRRHLTAQLQAEIGRSNRYAEPFSVILLDVDHFKRINDQHGHDTGDRVLKQMAKLLRQTCREVDSVARWGGEEFLVLCPATGLIDAARLADLLRQRVEQQDFGFGAPVTSSFGVASHRQGQTLDDLIKAADSALYQAKVTRNSVRLMPDPANPVTER